MRTDTNNRAIVDYRAKVTLWLAITALVLLPPFSINNFVHERYTLGVGSLLVIVILLLHTWTIHRGRYMPVLTLAGLVPAIIIFLAFSFQKQGIIGALWCYPSSIVFYFILPRRQAIFANVCLLAMAIPSAWFFLDFALATRVAATLIGVSTFGAIFLHIIERQQQEVEKKEIQRRDSMASASHELRTPLATLMAQIEAMRDGVRPLDQEQLTSVSHSVDHLTGLVSDLYLLSLADVSALSFNKGPQRLDEILDEAVANAQSKLADQNLSIVTSNNTPVVVIGDAKRLRQIIDNLLQNCFRYTTLGGEVKLTIKQHDASAELIVTDTGPGVSDDVLALLFDRFYRVDKSRSRKKGGTGLGLSLVKALTETHGGQVKAFHAPEGGLGISVTLPLYKESDKQEITDK